MFKTPVTMLCLLVLGIGLGGYWRSLSSVISSDRGAMHHSTGLTIQQVQAVASLATLRVEVAEVV